MGEGGEERVEVEFCDFECLLRIMGSACKKDEKQGITVTLLILMGAGSMAVHYCYYYRLSFIILLFHMCVDSMVLLNFVHFVHVHGV